MHKSVGVVVKYAPNDGGIVRITDEKDFRDGQEFTIASTHQDITLAEGITVEFLVVTGADSETLVALDVQPSIPTPSAKEILRPEEKRREKERKESSVIWSIVEKANMSVEGNADIADGSYRHRWLQTFIKEAGEGLGFTAVIERPILNGTQSVDVSLEKDSLRIACEISVSTTPSHESQNIKKCLRVGYTHVVSISSKRSKLNRIKKWVDREHATDKDILSRVAYLFPEEVPPFLEKALARITPRSHQMVIGGRKVTVNYCPKSLEEQEEIRGNIAKILAKAYVRQGSHKNREPQPPTTG